jgi:hypothetical protein
MTDLFEKKHRLRRIPQADPIIDTGQTEISTYEDKASFMAEELEKVFTPGKPGSKPPAIGPKREKWKGVEKYSRKEKIPSIMMKT